MLNSFSEFKCNQSTKRKMQSCNCLRVNDSFVYMFDTPIGHACSNIFQMIQLVLLSCILTKKPLKYNEVSFGASFSQISPILIFFYLNSPNLRKAICIFFQFFVFPLNFLRLLHMNLMKHFYTDFPFSPSKSSASIMSISFFSPPTCKTN